MIFYITRSDAQTITQQDSLRSVARALAVDYDVLHYDETTFVCSGAMPSEGTRISDTASGLYLVNANHPEVLMRSFSFAIIQSDEPYPLVRKKYGQATKLSETGIKFR